jgi:hypothetical protein
LFVCMPLAAFVLYLLYIRRKRNYYEFLIFSVYFHSFIFILMLFNKILIKIFGYIVNTDSFTDVFAVGIGIYFLLSLKRVYEQSWVKTILKAITFTVVYAFLIFFVVIGIILYLFAFSGGH